MADAKLPLDTPFLLKMDPKTALTVIAGYHNDQPITPDYVDVTAPTVLSGRKTRVTFTPNPYYQDGAGLGREYYGTFDLEYNRLDYATYFAGQTIEVPLDLPSDTRALAKALGQDWNIAFDDADVEMSPIGTATSRATIAATSQSLRWMGSIEVRVLYLPSLFDVIPTAYLNGLTMFDIVVDLDSAFVSDGVLPLFDPFVPQPLLSVVIGDPALDVVPGLGLGHIPIASYFPDTVLMAHWVVDEGIPSLVTDLTLTEADAFRFALNTVSVVALNDGDYAIGAITKDISQARNTRVRVKGLVQVDLQGVVDVHVNRIDLSLVFPNGLADVNVANGADEATVRAAILDQLNVRLESTVTAVDNGNGVWVFSASPDSLLFTGSVTIEAYPFWDGTPHADGFYRVPDTDYLVYDQTLAASWGPTQVDTPLADATDRWTARINEQNAIDVYQRATKQFTVLVQPNAPEGIDFTFQANGDFRLVYEAQGQLYLVAGNSTQYQSLPLGAGHRPFINRLTWDTERTTQDTYLFYTKATSVYYRRASESFATEYALGIDNALTVLATNHDALFRLVAHYLTVDGTIKTFSTAGGLVSVAFLGAHCDYLTGSDFSIL